MSPGLYLVLLVSLVTVVGLALALWRGQERLRRLEGKEVEARELAGQIRRLHQELEIVEPFLREFPQLIRNLQTRTTPRQIPHALLDIVQRLLKAEQTVVLLRRRNSLSDPGRREQLVVAAVAPTDSLVKTGTTLTIGEGEVGFAAEIQTIMDRNDFANLTAIDLQKIRRHNLEGFSTEIVAPMVFGGETLGAIALSHLHKRSTHQKEILRMIAQMGAFALDQARTFTNIRSEADVDPLTGIANKRVLTYRLGELLYETEANGSKMSVFLFDIDHFKNYNDRNGHMAGDQLLRILARLVRENVRSEDVFGRFGGEEFLLLLPDLGSTEAMIVAENIRRIIANYEFPFADRQPLGRVTVSGGVATFPAHGRNSPTLLQAADAALYEAKNRGRNQVVGAPSEGALGRRR